MHADEGVCIKGGVASGVAGHTFSPSADWSEGDVGECATATDVCKVLRGHDPCVGVRTPNPHPSICM